jgi:hypothetical protein
MTKLLGTVATAALLAIAAPAANAAVILTFGQTGSGNTITGTASGGTTTTISGTAIPVDITQIMAGAVTPVAASLTISATSTGAATSNGTQVTQAFSGSFSITNGATNYLSGTFTDAVFGSGTGLTMSVSNASPGESASFTSNVIPAADLGNPEAIDLALSNVTPNVGITGTTLASFTSSVGGNFSANAVATPEPASMALLGVGLFGLAFVSGKRQRR